MPRIRITIWNRSKKPRKQGQLPRKISGRVRFTFDYSFFAGSRRSVPQDAAYSDMSKVVRRLLARSLTNSLQQ